MLQFDPGSASREPLFWGQTIGRIIDVVCVDTYVRVLQASGAGTKGNGKAAVKVDEEKKGTTEAAIPDHSVFNPPPKGESRRFGSTLEKVGSGMRESMIHINKQ